MVWRLAASEDLYDDHATGGQSVRVIDVFVEELDLSELGFGGVDPEAIGRPSYHPSVLLKLYIYGYLNRVQSSRRLEREAARNVEVMWLNGPACPRSQDDCRLPQGRWHCHPQGVRTLHCAVPHGRPTTHPSVGIDGSKFKAVNNRDKNFTRAKMERRMAQIEESVARYLSSSTLPTGRNRQRPSQPKRTASKRRSRR